MDSGRLRITENHATYHFLRQTVLSSTQLFADYHFHPNFRSSWSRIRNKAARIWNAFDDLGLDVVVVTEHSYKSPVEAYEIMSQSRPPGMHTFLIPGVEVLTAEGMDVIVFGEDPKWYEDRAARLLMEPYGPTIHEVTDILASQDHLAGFLPHPYTLGTTGAIGNLGMVDSQQLARRIGGVETSNNCYSDTLFLADRVQMSKRMFPAAYDRMIATQQVTADFMEDWDHGFFAIGSDAHYPEELGHGVTLDIGRPSTDEEVFNALRSNQNHEGEIRGEKAFGQRVYHCTKSAIITGHEAFQKLVIRKSLRKEGTIRPLLATSS